jgi:phosphate transport system substrate-binding protein
MNLFSQNTTFALLKKLAVFVTGLGVLSAMADDKVTIRGSNTIGEELAPHLIAEYKKSHASANFDLEFKGTAYGIGALMGGFCDIAGASKPLNQDQRDLAAMHDVVFNEYVLGSYSVAILVNKDNPVSNLTSNQVQALFTGKVKNWKEVGGPDVPVNLYGRDPISGTHFGFKEIAMAYQDYDVHIHFFTNYLGVADAVAKDPNGIGYAGLDLVKHDGTKAVLIDGVNPSTESVNAKKYPFARTLYFYMVKDKEPVAAKAFVDFALSPGGQQVLTQMGYASKP